jgi:hypothetical protein
VEDANILVCDNAVEASRSSVQQWSNLEDEGATVLWNAHTMTPMTQHHIDKTWILTF